MPRKKATEESNAGKKATIRLAWPAITTDTPGLLVHRTTGKDETWVVSHETSGRYVVKGLPTKEAALNAAKRLGKLDWLITDEALSELFKANGGKVEKALHKLAAEFGGTR